MGRRPFRHRAFDEWRFDTAFLSVDAGARGFDQKVGGGFGLRASPVIRAADLLLLSNDPKYFLDFLFRDSVLGRRFFGRARLELLDGAAGAGIQCLAILRATTSHHAGRNLIRPGGRWLAAAPESDPDTFRVRVWRLISRGFHQSHLEHELSVFEKAVQSRSRNARHARDFFVLEKSRLPQFLRIFIFLLRYDFCFQSFRDALLYRETAPGLQTVHARTRQPFSSKDCRASLGLKPDAQVRSEAGFFRGRNWHLSITGVVGAQRSTLVCHGLAGGERLFLGAFRSEPFGYVFQPDQASAKNIDAHGVQLI